MKKKIVLFRKKVLEEFVASVEKKVHHVTIENITKEMQMKGIKLYFPYCYILIFSFIY